MAVRVLKKSCCCSLDIGTLVLAVLCLIGGAGGIIQAALRLARSLYYNQNGIILSLHSGFLGSSSIHFIIAILLIMAVKQRRSKLVIPWLVEMALCIAALVIFTIYCFVVGAMYAISGDFFLLMLAFGCLVVSGLNMYFWWIVYSFHHELKLEEKTKLLSSVGNHGMKMDCQCQCQNNYSKLKSPA